jgi:hypothetical protein
MEGPCFVMRRGEREWVFVQLILADPSDNVDLFMATALTAAMGPVARPHRILMASPSPAGLPATGTNKGGMLRFKEVYRWDFPFDKRILPYA